ncbi:MAG: Mfa1 family fimbria major subunit [Prevotella sp.]|jgi:hypothetical protein|nr:Mfa1 family fimbria major subunit [Prevotella sp.]
MKKLKSVFLLGALAIGLGLTSCSSDDGLANSQTSAEKGSTYASLSISFPTSSSTRALPDDYNSDGTWTGRDEIKSVSVFLYNSTLNTVDYSKFSASSFTGIDANGKLTPNIAVKATPGQNVKAYVVINDVNNDVVTKTLENAAKTPKTFDAAFAAEVDAVANQVSAYNTTDKKDVILMTNDVTPTATEIKPNITQDQAIKGPTNLIPVKVQRVVSRAIVTMPSTLLTDPTTNTIQLTDASGNDASKITITDLKYGVGQSGQSFYNLQKTDFSTPDAIYKGDASIGAKAMDNTGLNSFTEVTSIADNTNTSITGALSTETTDSKFVLPVTHAADGYFKGNTTYFEIRATFTPDKVDGKTYNPGTDVYLGQNDGLFYSTRALAEASGQKSTCYKGDGNTTKGGAITKYILWLNPNVVPGTGGTTKASMSPTVRNQVYNVYISGFKTIGIPNNPLNPADPNDSNNPDNPIKPKDPLETQDTYLSVTITVLPYTVHSYGINIGNDY